MVKYIKLFILIPMLITSFSVFAQVSPDRFQVISGTDNSGSKVYKVIDTDAPKGEKVQGTYSDKDNATGSADQLNREDDS